MNQKPIIYIAGPMSGLPDFNRPAFNEAADKLRAEGYPVNNPAELDGGSTDQPWEYYMRRALSLLVMSDEVRLLPGWLDSKGARLEVRTALALGLPVEGSNWVLSATREELLRFIDAEERTDSAPPPVEKAPPKRIEVFRDFWGCRPGTDVFEDGTWKGKKRYHVAARADEVEKTINDNPPPFGWVYNNEPVVEVEWGGDWSGIDIYTQPPAPLPPPPVEKAPPQETVLQEADRLVSGDRQSAYGHPYDDFTRTGKLWAPILGLDAVTPQQVALCMAALKISRLCHKHKRDSVVDLAGYAKCLELVHLEEFARTL